jgi:hypothetical protein
MIMVVIIIIIHFFMADFVLEFLQAILCIPLKLSCCDSGDLL